MYHILLFLRTQPKDCKGLGSRSTLTMPGYIHKPGPVIPIVPFPGHPLHRTPPQLGNSFASGLRLMSAAQRRVIEINEAKLSICPGQPANP
jgi:hypothetical protein